MNRSLVLAVVALGVWGLALGAEAYAWMPFYGDRTPNYMAQPCVYPTYQYVVPVQGTGPQVVTSYYPPAQARSSYRNRPSGTSARRNMAAAGSIRFMAIAGRRIWTNRARRRTEGIAACASGRTHKPQGPQGFSKTASRRLAVPANVQKPIKVRAYRSRWC